MKAIGVIPARWASTRLPEKVLADIHGRPMIQHIWAQAKQSRLLDEVLIACDHERVLKAAEGFKARAILTSPDHQSGTDRVAEVAAAMDADVVLNIQGDEPLLQPKIIDGLAEVMLDDPTLLMATVIKRIAREEELTNPNVVKVVVDRDRNALYFSRSTIPYNREKKEFAKTVYYKHFGIYAYRKDFLLNFKNLPASRLEDLEKLEQLRVLEAGHKIKTVETEYDLTAVDTAEDLERVRALMGSVKIQ